MKLKLIYNSLVKSHLEYGILAWGNSNSKEISKISIMQKKIIRNLDNSKYNAHTDPIFTKHNILKFNDILKLNSIILMYKYEHLLLPESFVNMFGKISDRSRNYRIDIVKNKTLEAFPKAYLPKIWNSLPMEVKYSNSLKEIKKNVKTHLLEVYKAFICNNRNCYSCTNWYVEYCSPCK